MIFHAFFIFRGTPATSGGLISNLPVAGAGPSVKSDDAAAARRLVDLGDAKHHYRALDQAGNTLREAK